MKVCHNLKGFCLANEWAGGTAALLGVGLLMSTIWVGIDGQLLIKTWVAQNLLPHGLLLGAATLVDVLLIFGLLCLGFSECSEADRSCANAYRGRRSVVFPELTNWIQAVGHNPRRQPRRS